MTSYEMFTKVKETKTNKEIADIIGINTGTIGRWMLLKDVPTAYMGDFSRILGLNIYGETEQDKDQYYTKKSVAKKCFDSLSEVLDKLPNDYSNHTFIEPSAGDGSFYDLLPKDKRIGVDLDPRHTDLIASDYLLWKPENKENNIVFGNPPFGLRGHLALQFINHSQDFADVVSFILPPLFNSMGRGTPLKRVKGYKLVHTEDLPKNSFEYPDKTEVDVTCIFQVWVKEELCGDHAIEAVEESCESFVKVYSLSDGGTPGSTRNKKMLNKCDVYLPSTCYTGMEAYSDFEDLPGRRGYGLVILKNKKEIKSILNKTNWKEAAFTSTNGALNLRLQIINKTIIEGGYYDI